MVDRLPASSIHLQAHPIVDLVIGEGDMILIYGIPFLKLDLLGVCASLCSDEALQIAHSIIWAALDPHFAPKSIVGDDFNHGRH